MPVAKREPTYVCPRGGGALTATPDGRLESTNAASYDVRNGVPSFLKYESDESDDDRELLAKLNRVAESDGWMEALKQTYGEAAGIYGYVTDTSRHVLLDLLPLTTSTGLLEIGCGLGQFTPAFAKRCGHVSAIDVVEEQAVFTRLRCLEEGCDNVDVVAGGDDCRLPYADESFDGVVLNLVLEWCGMREPDVPLIESQKRMLTQIHRVLKPGGFAFVATKNRYALRLLIGKRDGHAHNMRIGSALPRRLLRILLKRKGHSRPSGMLHSHGGFKQLLRDCGFSRVDPYWAAPNMRRPQRYIPANRSAIRAARSEGGFSQGNGRVVGRLMPLAPANVVPYISYGNVAVAYK